MSSVNNNQRQGSVSNTHVGTAFEEIGLQFYKKKGFTLERGKKVEIGISSKKVHKFDLGNETILVECKSYKWTSGDNIPSAKIRSLNEAMFYFYLAPKKYKKYLFIINDYNLKRHKTLVEYFVENFYYFIPKDVEIHEYSEDNKKCNIYKFNQDKKRHIKI